MQYSGACSSNLLPLFTRTREKKSTIIVTINERDTYHLLLMRTDVGLTLLLASVVDRVRIQI